MAEKVSLDQVNISVEAFKVWQEIAGRIAIFLKGFGVPLEEIPDEQVRVEDDGSLTIFVEVEIPSGGKIEPSLKIPPKHWTWRYSHN